MALGRLEGMKGVTVLRAREIKLSSGAKVHVQIDGEYAGQLPAELRIVPDAVRLLVPDHYGKAV